MKAAGKRPGKRPKLPVKNVEIQFAGSQKEGIPVVDSRPGKKHTKAGRKRKSEGRGRKKVHPNEKRQDAVDVYAEVVIPSEARLHPTAAQLLGQKAVDQEGIQDDPMLEEELLRPLIVNELADDGIFVVDNLDNQVKIWDAEVSCTG